MLNLDLITLFFILKTEINNLVRKNIISFSLRSMKIKDFSSLISFFFPIVLQLLKNTDSVLNSCPEQGEIEF